MVDVQLHPHSDAVSVDAKSDGEDVPRSPPCEGSARKRALDFVSQISGLRLGQLSDEALEDMIYANRFDLLPPRAPGAGCDAGAGAGRQLPCMDAIPTASELHDAFVGCPVKDGIQCIAHLLYPDHVAWPAEPEDGSDGDTGSASSSAGSSRQSESEPGDPSGAEGPDEAVAVSRSPSESPPSAHAVVLCGTRVTKTVRGKGLAAPSEDVSGPGEVEALRAQCAVARKFASRLDRQAKRELYSETQLEERIRALMALRVAEAEQIEEMQKRDATRRARSEQLKRDLKEQQARRTEQERTDREQARQREEEAAEAHRKWERHCRRQKELLSSWKDRQGLPDISAASARRGSSAPPRQAAPTEPAYSSRTVKQFEAEERIQRYREALDQRPPIAPRPHDLPRPVLQLWDIGIDSGSRSVCSARSHRTPRQTWSQQVQVVSSRYGLSEEEQGIVTSRLTQTVQGAGRMAAYETD